MLAAKRFKQNPLLTPDAQHAWESEAVFNGCPVARNGIIHFCYRAMSSAQSIGAHTLNISSIGYAQSTDGIHFNDRRQLVVPEYEWERYGCEDPRVTKIGDTFYILYTALSKYPFEAEGIKVGVALTKDFKKIIAKYPVTFFNSKAMALFPDLVNDTFAAILAVHTDRPPVKIALAYFDRIEDMWNHEYWQKWYADLDAHTIDFQRGSKDHVEVGAAPIKTKDGWLLIYSDIKDYHSPRPVFGIQAVLLDFNDPTKIVGRTEFPLLTPQEEYERYGKVPNIVFPSGSIERGKKLYIYYSGADTSVCGAELALAALLKEMKKVGSHIVLLNRSEKNPIITPDPNHSWEAKATFNPGAILLRGKTHILYRAMSHDNTSTIGYASSKDGIHIDERLPEPAYVPREPFEQKQNPGGNSGCEDPRLVNVGNKIYMFYTAYDGVRPPVGAMTNISVRDFIQKRWNWTMPKIITSSSIDDKDVAMFPKKVKGKYVFLHRPYSQDVWIDFRNDLLFQKGEWLMGEKLFGPREEGWDTEKVGIAGPPIETKRGWLLLYHGVSKVSMKYRVGAIVLDLKDPRKILARSHDPIFEPQTKYEKEGQVRNVVFPCGHAIRKGIVYIYYGGADTVIGVATVKLNDLLAALFSRKD